MSEGVAERDTAGGATNGAKESQAGVASQATQGRAQSAGIQSRGATQTGPTRSPMGVMGVETEYAVSDLDDPHANPIQLSHDVIAAASQSEDEAAVRWDYCLEDPINDARGMHLQRAQADPSMLTDSPQLQATNRVQRNGSRIYVDHAHPEYSAPECVGPFESLAYGRAGDVLMREAARRASQATGRRIVLHRNNADGKGASWGAHENYHVPRATPFQRLADLFTVHAVTRQIYTGSGRVGLGEHSETPGFQLSQRADYFHARIGLQTTFDRPIVNTRDESHSTDEFRRFHVIAGDANRMDVPEVLKLGTTAMVLWLAQVLPDAGFEPDATVASLMPADPVRAMQAVSHDLTLREPLDMADGGRLTAWQIQLKLRGLVYAAASQIWGCTSLGEPLWPDDDTRRIMDMWGDALQDVGHVMQASDDDRLGLDQSARVEWLLKWQILESLRRRKNSDWTDMRLRAADIAWAALEPRGCVFEAVKSRTDRVADDEAIAEAVARPPADTRAWLRGTLVAGRPGAVRSAGWGRIVLQDSDGAPYVVDCSDPRSHTQDADAAAVRAFLDDGDVAAFVAALSQR